MITRLPDGRWLLDIQPGGRGKRRIRKIFDKKRDAIDFQNAREFSLLKSKEKPKKEIPKTVDKRTLLDLINLWFDLHGNSLKSSADTLKRLYAISAVVGNPKALDFTAAVYASYRSKRLASGIKPATLNRERVTLNAVFSELSRLGHWDLPNPIAKVRPLRVDQAELSFLTDLQIQRLFDSLAESSNPDVWLFARVALATGARWSEVAKLRQVDVSLPLGQVAYHRTKSGKSRYIPLEPDLLARLYDRLGTGPFCSCYAAFRSALERSGIVLPAGQSAHVLRHTFASHFLQKGGDILTLQKILGHSSIQVTMRYSHLMPSALHDAKRFNPLSGVGAGASLSS